MSEHEHSPEAERQFRVEQKKKTHAEAYPTEIQAYVDVDVRRGAVADCSAQSKEEKLSVPTDSAAIFSRDHHAASGIFYGCGAFLLSDGAKVLLAHMTPGNRMQYLGWQLQKGDPVDRSTVDSSLDGILKAAQAAGMDLAATSFKLIAEPGISHQDPKAPVTKYSIESTEESFDHIRAFLASRGIRGDVTQSTVSDFTVIIDPQEQGVFVTGYANAYENGVLKHRQQQESVKTLFVALPSSRKNP